MESRYLRDNELDGEVFRSGQCVPPGMYREIHSNIVIMLDQFQALPCSDDGGRIEYRRLSDYPSAGAVS
jgi:hypothetical protein